MVAKNKVKKVSFTELYLINKKTLNLLKKKKKDNTYHVQQTRSPSITPAIYQTHHHYTTSQPISGEHFRQNENMRNSNTIISEDPSYENPLSNSVNGNTDDEYFDDNLGEILADENLLDENSGNNNNIIPNGEVTRVINIPTRDGNASSITQPQIIIPPSSNNPQFREQIEDSIIIENPTQEDMDEETENHQIPSLGIVNYNSRRKNINFLNQSKRASYLNRKRGNTGDINIIKSVLQGEIKKMREKSREQKNKTFREKPEKNLKPSIVIQPPNNDNMVRVLNPAQSTSLGGNNFRSNVLPLISMRSETPIATLNNNNIIRSHENHHDIPTVNISPQATANYVNSSHITRENNTTRKRSRPANVVVRNNPIPQAENMDIESIPHSINNDRSSGMSGNQSNTGKTNEQFPKRTKIHKKSKVIIIEPPEAEKPKNSEFVDKILQSNEIGRASCRERV
jgi:hypothetical protein